MGATLQGEIINVIRRFSVMWSIWTFAIIAFALLAGGLGGGDGGETQAIRWLAGAMTLAAFPAGVHAAPEVVEWKGGWLPKLLTFAGVTLVLGGLVFCARAFIEPALVPDAASEPASWSLGERLEALAVAEEAAEREGTLESWISANRIGWEVDTTVTTALTAIGFAWVGALLAAWLPAGLRREARLSIIIGTGLFLLLTGYLMTENGYELLLLRTVGPAYVTAWFPLIAPGLMTVGLLIPTLARLTDTDIG